MKFIFSGDNIVKFGDYWKGAQVTNTVFSACNFGNKAVNGTVSGKYNFQIFEIKK